MSRSDAGPRPSALLVSYPGYPSSLDSLMPDNGLAGLAGCLAASGWRVRILDYATTDTIGRLVPARLRWRLRGLALGFIAADRLRLPLGRALARGYQEVGESLAEHARQVQDQIADEIVAEARRLGSALVGFKLWTGAGQQGTAAIARHVRRALPAIRIYGGGPHAECFGSQVLEQLGPAFDAVALGEGERTIRELGEHALGTRPLDRCSGVAFRREGTTVTTPCEPVADIGELPDPCYDPDTYPAMQGDRKLKLMMIDESRGCPYSCAFCFHPAKSGRRRRARRPAQVAGLMERLARRCGSRAFRLAGSNPSPALRAAIAEELVRSEAGLRYISFGHTRSRGEPFGLLRRAGCVSLFFGVESCNQAVLDKLNKRTRVASIVENLAGARRAGIMATASLIVPCPGDTARTLQQTIAVMAATRPAGVSIYLPLVVPRSDWFARPQRHGFRLAPGALETLMRYQVRFLMPPPFWDPLPYTLDGRDYPAMVAEAMRASAALERRGVLTGVNDSLLLVARELRLPGRRLRDLNRRLFMTADAAGIERITRRFNAVAGQAAGRGREMVRGTITGRGGG